ncbi:MAG: helix-turn-helix domain-containing protein [Methylosarcina sp.]
MPKKYIVRLSETERQHLTEVIKKLQGTAQKVRRAQVLLKADAGGPSWTDQRIAEAYACRINTVEKIRQRFVEEGFERALEGRKREYPPTPRLLDGEQEARIIATGLGSPPSGYGHWSLRLLAERVVELGIVPAISHETVRKLIKKTA